MEDGDFNGDGWSVTTLPRIVARGPDGRVVNAFELQARRVLAYLCYIHGREDGTVRRRDAERHLGISQNQFSNAYTKLREALPNAIDDTRGATSLRSGVHCDAAVLRGALAASQATPDPASKLQALKPVLEGYGGPFANEEDGEWERESRKSLHRLLDEETQAVGAWLGDVGRRTEALELRSRVVSKAALAQDLIGIEAAQTLLRLAREAGEDPRSRASELAAGCRRPEDAGTILAYGNALLAPTNVSTPKIDPVLAPLSSDDPPTDDLLRKRERRLVRTSAILIATGLIAIVGRSAVALLAPGSPRDHPQPPSPSVSETSSVPLDAPLMEFWRAADRKDFHTRLPTFLRADERNEIDARLLYRADALPSSLTADGDRLLGLLSPERLSVDTTPVQSLAFSPDGRTLYSGHGNLDVPVGDPSDRHPGLYPRDQKWPIYAWRLDGRAKPTALLGHRSAVLTLSISPDGNRLVSSGRDGTSFVWDLATQTKIAELVQPPYPDPRTHSEVAGTCYLSDHEVLGTVQDGLLRWTLPERFASATGIERIQPHPRILRKATDGKSVDFSSVQARGGRVLTSGGNNLVYLWSRDIGDPRTFQAGNELNCAFPAVFSADGTRLAVGANDHDVRVWKANSQGEPPLVLKGLDKEVHALAFSASGHRLVTGDQAGRVSVWDLNTGGRLLLLVVPNADEIRALAIASGDAALAVACHDGSVYLWRFAE